MNNDNLLLEREFDISLDGQNYTIKAWANFIVNKVAPQERGFYYFFFIFRGRETDPWRPNQTISSRKQAKEFAEFVFSSGQVEAYVRSRIQTWINVGL
jgi:hypothetical protein